MLTQSQNYLQLLTADTTFSNRARLFGIQQAVEMYQSNQAFGVGIENYKRVIEKLNVVDSFKKGAHNEVLRIAAELGTVGLVFYFGMYAMAAARVRKVLPSMPLYTSDQQLRLRLGVGLMAYGFAANLFLGGGGINLFLIFLPAALIHSVPVLVDRKTSALSRQRQRLGAHPGIGRPGPGTPFPPQGPPQVPGE